MPTTLGRGALAILCVFAVAFAGLLFAASGFGSPPGGDAGVLPGGPTAGDGGTEPAPATPGPATPDDPRSSPSGSTDASGETGTDAGEQTPKRTESQAATPSSTETATPAGDDETSGLLGTVASLFASVLAVVLVSVVSLVFYVKPREDDLPLAPVIRQVPGMGLVIRAVSGIPQVTMLSVLGFATATAAFARQLATVAAGTGRAMGALGRGVTVGLGSMTVGVGVVLSSLGGLFGGGVAGIGRVLSTLSVGGGSEHDVGERPDRDPRVGAGSSEPEPDDDGPPSIEEAWLQLVEPLRVSRPGSTTPAEYARIAVDRGLPEESVAELTRVFRTVRYGNQPVTDGRLATAREAIEAIAATRGESE